MLKSSPVDLVVDMDQVYEPFPLLPIGVLALMVSTAVPAFNRTIFTCEPGLAV
jgi:hypothetical protein